MLDVIVPSQPLPARLGLLASVVPVEDTGRWGGSIWTPWPCGLDGGTYDWSCGITTDLDEDESGTVADPVDTGAFGVFRRETCGTFSDDVDLEARVRNSLAVGEQWEVEREFLLGTQVTAAATHAQFLTDANLTVLNSSNPTSPIRALGDVEQSMGECRAGGRGFIHASRRTVTFWVAAGLLYRVGNVLMTTATDTIVVPGEGYNGAAQGGAVDATGDTAWVYATGQVEIRRSEVKVFGPDAPAVTTRNNRVIVATRLYSIQFDPCCQLGIKVQHCRDELCT